MSAGSRRRALVGAYGRHAPWHPGKQTLVHHLGRLLGLEDRSTVETTTWFGARLLCSMEDGFERRVVYFGTHEHRTERLIHALLCPGDTFVDVGANIGVFSLLAALRVGPGGRVFSLEPVPATFERLQRNVALNRVDNVVALNLAAWHEPSELVMACPVDPRVHSGVFHVVPGASAGAGSGGAIVHVPALPLDALLLERHHVARVDLMKLDIEGAELPALEGSRRLLVERRPVVVTELDERHTRRHGYAPGDLVRFMVSLGYAPFALDEDYRPRHRPGPLRPLAGVREAGDNVVFVHPGHRDFARLEAGARF